MEVCIIKITSIDSFEYMNMTKKYDLVFTNYLMIGYQYTLHAYGSRLASTGDALLIACPWDPRVNGEFFSPDYSQYWYI